MAIKRLHHGHDTFTRWLVLNIAQLASDALDNRPHVSLWLIAIISLVIKWRNSDLFFLRSRYISDLCNMYIFNYFMSLAVSTTIDYQNYNILSPWPSKDVSCCLMTTKRV